MSFSALRIMAYALGILGSSFLLPLAIAIWQREYRMVPAFLLPMAAGWAAAIVFSIKAVGKPREIGLRSAFGIVGGIWVSACIFGSIPLVASGAFSSFGDALFESVSGFTTTGATVLTDVEALPRSLNLWRCLTHWLGGMGVIALAVALIPLLGVGGFRLVKAETTGPDKGKVTAQIANTAKALWFLYVGLTGAEALLLWGTGMDALDAVSHAFSTLGTGGFSTRNASISSYQNPATEWVVCAFMALASVNFALYYRFFSRRIRDVFRDTELRVLVGIFVVATVAVVLMEVGNDAVGLRQALFQVATVVSSTGFMSSDYAQWHAGSQMILFALFFVGGSSGSTAGGVKVIRWVLLAKQFRMELRRLLHPHEVSTLRLNGVPGRESLVPGVAGFLFVYFALVVIVALCGAIAGLDVWTAFTAALSMVGNVGPAFGALGPTETYAALPMGLKMIYCVAMLAGRLEIYTLLLFACSFQVGRTPRVSRDV